MPMLRRFVLMVVGMGVGAAMFAAAESFDGAICPRPSAYSHIPNLKSPSSFYDSTAGR